MFDLLIIVRKELKAMREVFLQT